MLLNELGRIVGKPLIDIYARAMFVRLRLGARQGLAFVIPVLDSVCITAIRKVNRKEIRIMQTFFIVFKDHRYYLNGKFYLSQILVWISVS